MWAFFVFIKKKQPNWLQYPYPFSQEADQVFNLRFLRQQKSVEVEKVSGFGKCDHIL